MAFPVVSISEEGDRLRVTLDGGHQRSIDVGTLWSACPGAAARRRRLEQRNAAPPDLRIASLAEVGYGLHVAFSADAHGGVFPWPMIIELSQRPQMHDFIISSPSE